MPPRLPAAAAVVVSALLAACGSTAPASHGASTPWPGAAWQGSGPTPTASAGPTGTPTVARPDPSDTTAAANPGGLYAGGGATAAACAPVTATEPAVDAPNACFAAWGQYVRGLIPGPSVTSNAPLPKNVTVEQGVPPDLASQIAQAYERTIALQAWAIQQSDDPMVMALNPPGTTYPLDQALQAGGVVEYTPACGTPTAIRVVELTPAEVTAVQSNGWPNASASGVEVTLAKCGPVVVQFPDKHSEGFDAVAQPETNIIVGQPVQQDPFGLIFSINGEATCGELAALAPLCGG